MRAGDLAEPFPTVLLSADALMAARLIGEARLPGLIVCNDDGSPYTVLGGSQVLRFMIPQYIQDDPTLARVYDDAAAEKLLSGLSTKTVRDLLPRRQDRSELPVVDRDATTVEIAAVMAQLHSPVVGRGPGDRGCDGQSAVRASVPGLARGGRGSHVTTVLVLIAFVAAYVLIATERIHRVAAALCGASAMVLLGVVDARVAFFSQKTGVDWNVIFLLLGMMVIVGVLRRTGVFEFAAIWSAKRAAGRPFPVLVMLIVLTAVASALLDNVTTVLLIAPVSLLVCEQIDAPPVPFLIAEVMASNIGGTATLIGDPPNIIIASRSGLSFNDFALNLAPIVVILVLVLVLMCRVMFRSAFTFHPDRVEALMCLEEREAIRDVPLLIRSGVVLAGVLAGFVSHPLLGVDPSLVALLGAGALVAISRMDAEDYLADVEWSTLVFFMGLFVMVGALVEVGVIGRLAQSVTSTVADHYFVGSTVLVFASAILSGVVDNIPYVATMSPLVADLVQTGGGSARATPAWWALALGADLGGNATTVGASAKRGRARDRCAKRAQHHLLGLHEIRAGGRGGHGADRLGLRRPAVLRLHVTKALYITWWWARSRQPT